MVKKAMADEWLTTKKKQDTADIRRYIPVFGRVLKPKIDPANDNSTSLQEPTRKRNLKQYPITDFNPRRLSKDSQSQNNSDKVPVFAFSTGVRKKLKLPIHSDDEDTRSTGSHSDKEYNESAYQYSTHTPQLESSHSKIIRERNATVIEVQTERKNLPPDTRTYESGEEDPVVRSLSKKSKHFSQGFKLDITPLCESDLSQAVINTPLEDSVVDINTNDLLADLSNCEKMVNSG